MTQREIEGHFKEKAAKALASLKTFRREAAILSPFPAPFDLIVTATKESLQKAFKHKRSMFCDDLSINVLPIDNVQPAVIMDAYFGTKPPFGEGKKKSEFPDAFAAQALEDWCKAKEQKMVVVSGDGD